METHKSTINRDGEKATLIFSLPKNNLEIVLTEDKPNEVKKVFNQLILELKKGEFQFELEDTKEDLYYHISEEYISQLNSELSSIYSELEDYDLLEKTEEE